MNNNCLSEKTPALVNSTIVNNIINVLTEKNKKYLAVMPLSINAESVKMVCDVADSIYSLKRRVLLVDATSRNKSFISEDRRIGFAEYVCNDASLSDCVYQENESYDVMPAGDFDDGIRIIHNVALDDKMKLIEEQYDLILVIVSNVNENNLKSSFANRIGLSMILVNKDKDKKVDLITARNTLKNCIGIVVLNKRKKTFKDFFANK